ncbi:FAD-dependent monooxygenase [Streptomyces sp. NPDC050287]|uniref:FAD-dependent monooxygenase n=1 Tax=Streptomyces sp. NPDC050287 TaxID=3365608 RepID=UPI0037A1A406
MSSHPHRAPTVLIVGGGPAGLCAAALLGARGIDVLLVERHRATSTLPRAHLLNQRTMEIFTEMGVADAVYALSPPEDRWHKVAWHTTLAGSEAPYGQLLGALPAWGGGPDAERYARASPCRYANVPQLRLDPLLRARAEEVCGPENIRFHHELTALSATGGRPGEGVVATVVDRDSGRSHEVRARYVIAADGGRTCADLLGVEMDGPTGLLDMVTVHATMDLSKWITDDNVLLRYFINPDGQGTFAGALCAMGPDRWGRDSAEWAVHTGFRTGDPDRTDRTAVLGRVRRMLGVPDLDIQVHAISHWEFEGIVARRMRVGPVFLAGNAAHRHPPTGGLGLNMAVQDVHNLVWKLDAVLSGQASDALLDSYEAERLAVDEFNVRHCLSNAGGHARIAAALGLRAGLPETEGWDAVGEWLADTPGGAAKRAAVAEAIESNADDYSQLGVELGYHYASGALVPDGTDAPNGEHPLRDYVPTTRPGHHLPHVWVSRKGSRQSVQQLIAPDGLTLLVGTRYAARWAAAARTAGDATATVHVRVIGADAERTDSDAEWTDRIGEWATVRGVDGSGALLVRPDRHIAWRAPGWSDDRPAELRRAVCSTLGLPVASHAHPLPAPASLPTA